MSTSTVERHRGAVIGLMLLLAARAADTATSLPVLIARPSAELNPMVQLWIEWIGIPGYVAVSLAAAPIVILVGEWAIRNDPFEERAIDPPNWVLRAVLYLSPTIVTLGAVANNVVQLAKVV